MTTGPKGDAGFTLIEMIVVLVILALIAAVVVQRGPMRSPALEARAAASEVAGALRLARARAIAGNRPVTFTLDVAAHRYSIDNAAPRPLPPQIGIVMTTLAGATLAERIGAIGFAPDGSSTGGRVELIRPGQKIAVGVDWLTGRISVAEAR